MRRGSHTKKLTWAVIRRRSHTPADPKGHPREAVSRPGSRFVIGRYAVALFIASAVLFSTPALDGLHSVATADTPAAACPGGVSQCVTVQIPCTPPATCPTIVAGPTTNVGNGQYVYLSMSNFPSTDEVRVALCPITNPPIIYPTG